MTDELEVTLERLESKLQAPRRGPWRNYRIVKRLQGAAHDAYYAPPVEPMIIDLYDVSTARPVTTKRPEQCVEVVMKNGDRHVCVGVPADFLPVED